MIEVTVTLDEIRSIVRLADAAVRASGLEAARVAVPLLDAIQERVERAERTAEGESHQTP